MKTKVFIYILLICLPVLARSQNNDLYIYRNDGRFNAFYSNEIDSMSYSKIDLNGIERPEFVMQEIWTADSVYRIPMAVIDSISVKAPEVRYTNSVKKLTDQYIPYIRKVDGLHIVFSNELPYSLRINKGDILVFEGFEDPFPDGFVGRVTTIANEESSININCDPVGLEEVYDQFISVGNYVLQEENSGPQKSYSFVREAPNFDIVSSTVPFERYINFGNDILNGGINFHGTISSRLKCVCNISNGNTYIELIPKYNIDLGANIEANFDIPLRLENDVRFFSIPINFSAIPILKGVIDLGGFVKASLSGKASLNWSSVFEGGMSFVYDNGHYTATRITPTHQLSAEGSLGLEGNLWFGVNVAPGISGIGNTINLSLVNGLGPNFELDTKFIAGQESSYDAVKDSNLKASIKFASELQVSTALNNKFHIDRELGPSMKFFENTFYLLPEFNNFKVTTNKTSINVEATAVRKTLLPCRVGFCVLDENENIIETYYSGESKTMRTPELSLSHTFDSGLNQGEKYIVRPIVSLSGFDFQAHPEEECYLDCNISTGIAYASINAFEMSATVDSNLSSDVVVGVVYTTEKIDPRIENSNYAIGSIIEPGLFKASQAGLNEGTTYYYSAFIYNNEKYYYGDTQCVTTKRSIDKFNEDNRGGGYQSGSKPYVSSGAANDIDKKSATITLSYDVISPNTECGYYLVADSKRAGTVSTTYNSIGTVTGTQTKVLEDLIPGTQYTYWAIAKNSEGQAISQKRTFETDPSDDPICRILGIDEIGQTSATIACLFENIEDATEIGCEYIDGDFIYKKLLNPDESGKISFTLDNLLSETEYTIRPYVIMDDPSSPCYDAVQSFSTKGPDITGVNWHFYDGGVSSSDGHHNLILYDSGLTNKFWGVNYLEWERTKRSITLIWPSYGQFRTYWIEYRGEFNEDFTEAHGEAFWIYYDTNVSDYVNSGKKGDWYMVRNSF